MADEKRLIYADSLITGLNRVMIRGRNAGKTMAIAEHIVKTVIADASTVDAVEVVRCRDCKHWHEETGWCNQHSHFVDIEGGACHPWESSEWKMFAESDFCSYGERRNDGNGRSDQ